MKSTEVWSEEIINGLLKAQIIISIPLIKFKTFYFLTSNLNKKDLLLFYIFYLPSIESFFFLLIYIARKASGLLSLTAHVSSVFLQVLFF